MIEHHPFTPERQIGVVVRVEGSLADVAFDAGARLPRSHFGEYLSYGDVGEFILVDVGGVAVFGRLLSVASSSESPDGLVQAGRKIPVSGRVQLLSTLRLDGTAVRGVARYPKVGDRAYAASTEAIVSVLGSKDATSVDSVALGQLSVDSTIIVSVPLTTLFGRHLAIVGATGSGKSWTLAHLVESVNRLCGKILLVDATGEFSTMNVPGVTHVSLGSTANEPGGTKLVGVPHFAMRETDRNAFLNPSSGAQLPKLREAVRSLRMAWAIMDDASCHDHRALVDEDGAIRKANRPFAAFGGAAKKYAREIEDPKSPFNIRLLARQIQFECVWQNESNNASTFGNVDNSQIGYVSSLVSRINDLMQTSEVMEVIDPDNGTANLLDEMQEWLADRDSHVLRISLRSLTFANHLREIIVNIVGQTLLTHGRNGEFRSSPLVVAVDEAHQFFDVTVGDEFANARLNAFDSIAKEGRKYGLTVCVATQRPSDLPAGVLSQVGMTIAHRLADGRDRQRVEQAAAELDHSAIRLLPGLVPGEAILMGVDFPVPVSVQMKKPLSPPESEGPAYSCWRLP